MKHKLTARKYSVRIKDNLKGLLMAGGTAAGTMIQKVMDQSLLGNTPSFPTWKLVCMASIAAALTYIVRKYLVDDVKIAEKTIEENEKNES
jgi:hypothetical protein